VSPEDPFFGEGSGKINFETVQHSNAIHARKKKTMKDTQQTPITQDLPLACTLTESEQKIRSTELQDLFKHVQQTNELVDGYALRFPGDNTWANTLLQFITYERACCPFFTFALIFEPQQGSIWLQLRGPEGVKPIVDNMMHS
jgi:hypothetical protein